MIFCKVKDRVILLNLYFLVVWCCLMNDVDLCGLYDFIVVEILFLGERKLGFLGDCCI